MDDARLISRTAANRRLFADVLDELGEAHAHDATLCAGWDVRTLAGHQLQPVHVPSWRFLLTAARQRSMARACDVHAVRLGDRPLAEIAAELRERATDGSRPWFIGRAGPFTDSCIHLRDLAEPQGLDVTVPIEDWRTALEIIVSPRGRASFLPVEGLLDGLRWAATDVAWVHGEGSAVTGSAEALAMVMSGRSGYLDRIRGEGLAVLRARLE
ncbi:maleylpyruvate isomerase family mycothiol-dependent enzyme [Janibacter sp. Soil728]|uniref:maleylpyruvate isomerase family mycothiol-dependent enzyme n=1 Tax=Janibacter sp. Soil728 TaxID=1736393 RepID=UPI0012E86461|nr:maleylpyruvate isomerase family mycothiol-dependent enzyme [Janibacter sp. Soil728]